MGVGQQGGPDGGVHVAEFVVEGFHGDGQAPPVGRAQEGGAGRGVRADEAVTHQGDEVFKAEDALVSARPVAGVEVAEVGRFEDVGEDGQARLGERETVESLPIELRVAHGRRPPRTNRSIRINVS